jgi:cation/acetate symporter
VGLAFAVAASANVPAILLTLFWRRFNTTGMLAGMLTGLISSIVLIALGPAIMGAAAVYPLENPGLVSVPLGFLGAVVGTLLGRDPGSEAKYPELAVRANTGIGAEA